MDKGLIVTNRKKYIILLIIIVLILGLYLSKPHMNSKEDLSTALHEDELIIDYVKDEDYVYLLINKNGIKDYGDTFAVFERRDNTWNRIYENDFKNLMPWKLRLADIDGDDVSEVLIALRKVTPYDKEIKNRMFIFNYKDNILSRKWTGSQIAGLWRDFYPLDLLSTPGYELVFIEQTKDNMEKISVYSWFDFGFFMLAESEVYPRIKTLHMPDKNLLEITYNKDEQEIKKLLTVVNGKLLEKDNEKH